MDGSLTAGDLAKLARISERNARFQFKFSVNGELMAAQFPMYIGTNNEDFQRHRELSLKIRRLRQDPEYFARQKRVSDVPEVPVSRAVKPLGVVLVNIMCDELYRLPVKTPLKTCGLINMGNICYMNSVLQMLLHCEPFVKTMEVISQETGTSLLVSKSQTPLVDSLVMLIELFKNTSKKSVSPSHFFQSIAKLSRFQHLRWGRQEDAEEFLGYLLDGLHEEFIIAMKSLPEAERVQLEDSGVLKALEGDSVLEVDDGWQEVGGKKPASKRTTEVKPSPITVLFGGQFRSVLEVPKQKESRSITLDPFMHVQLDISGCSSLEEAFGKFSEREEIPYRGNSGDDVLAQKQTSIHGLPRILVIHLKRFKYVNDEFLGRIEKLNQKVRYGFDFEIPPESISNSRKLYDTTPLVSQYRLIGVVYHHGEGAEGGHYTADVKQGAKWIRIDDSNVSDIEPAQVVETDDDIKTAYILTYQRIDLF